jgi:hypothetical protein
VTPLVSHNPIRIAFHEWLKMAKDLLGARTGREVIGYLFGPPAWRPDKTVAIAAAPVDGGHALEMKPSR